MSLEGEWRETIERYENGIDGAVFKKTSIGRSLLAEYRCRRRGCLLLRVWNTPNGPEFFAPPAGLPDWYAAAGQLHWPSFDRDETAGKTAPRAGRLNNPIFEGRWLWLLCDHLRGVLWTRDLRKDIEGQTPGAPVRINLPRDTPGQPHPREGL